MANFRARMTSPVYIQPWLDLPTEIANPFYSDPSLIPGVTPEQIARYNAQTPATLTVGGRLNPVLGLPHTYFVAEIGTPIRIKCTPNETGVEGDVDANLGGRLFTWWVMEQPPGPPFVITTVAANSSDASFLPPVVGHYLVVVDRASGGGIGIHFDVVAVRDAAQRGLDGAVLLPGGAPG